MRTSLAVLALLGAVFASDPFMGEDQKSGLVQFSNGDDMFYWLFRSRRDPDSDPVVMWLTGGPGCSSETALFYENGPFGLNDDLSLFNNTNSWTDVANVVWVDQPVGTGFSKCSSLFHFDTNEDEVAAALGQLLTGFVEQNPEFQGRDFYVTGESYAGHYIPAISYYIVNNMSDFSMNFKGMAIGNGWVDPYNQYPQYAEFAYENGLVGDAEYEILKAGFVGCQKLITSDHDTIALEACQILTELILGNPLNPKFNPYDIRIGCEVPPLCYDFSNAGTYLNEDDIQEQLGVSGRKWKDCKKDVQIFMMGDWLNDLANKVADVANKGYTVLVYSGDKDFICNWRGGEAWTSDLQWDHSTEFNQQSYKEWTLNGNQVGAIKEYENFHFLRVYNAGHMVPMDQPEVALAMLSAFITGETRAETIVYE